MNPPRNMLGRDFGQQPMQDAPPMNMLARDGMGYGQPPVHMASDRGQGQGQPFPLKVPGRPPQQLPPQAYIDELAERGGDDALEEAEYWIEQSAGSLKAPWDREIPPHKYSPGYQLPRPDARGQMHFDAANPNDVAAFREHLKSLEHRDRR